MAEAHSLRSRFKYGQIDKDHDDGYKVVVTTGALEFSGKITQHIEPKLHIFSLI